RIREYPTRYIADSAIELLKSYEEDDGQPWFLYVAPFAPHYPWVPAARYKDAPVPPWNGPPPVSRAELRSKPAWVRDSGIPTERTDKARNHQLRTLMSVDDLVDRVLGEVDDLDETRDTIVFYLSDNGYHWGEHGLGEKSSPYIDSVAVPFFARWPGRFPAGETDARLVANIDIVPTVLEATGIPPAGPEHMDGISLLGDDKREALLLEHWKEAELNLKVPSWRSIITADEQYIRTYGVDGTREELYDLTADPGEVRNLARDHAYLTSLRRLRRGLQAAMYCRGAGCLRAGRL
ncbi:MAG: hypothetical protein QOH26_1250, partial [Actinomycetota bacterium]|nr:hypothetical protein [Actinomycetota bacterium]